jgi:hypothetical protein
METLFNYKSGAAPIEICSAQTVWLTNHEQLKISTTYPPSMR